MNNEETSNVETLKTDRSDDGETIQTIDRDDLVEALLKFVLVVITQGVVTVICAAMFSAISASLYTNATFIMPLIYVIQFMAILVLSTAIVGMWRLYTLGMVSLDIIKEIKRND